ncbi:MAG: SPOR domain-containing protein [Bacteroidetes bacterium]|nr:SPOR domain-containing protein [Bacteroidota bacterium]
MRIQYSIIFLSCLLFINITAQEIDIVDYLKRIEAGEIENVKNEIVMLRAANPNDPSVKFLDAVLTNDGNTALKKYEDVYLNSPQSRYADAALYRIFSYYYSLGVYNKAESYLNELKSRYPSSPYIKAADRNIPDHEESITDSFDKLSEIANTPPKQNVQQKFNFTVQAGAFLSFENADKLKNDLINSGYPSEVTPKSVGGSILNVVTVGKLLNEKEADPILNLLKQKFKLNGRVISIAN